MNGYATPGYNLGSNLYSLMMSGQQPRWFMDYLYSFKPAMFRQSYQQANIQQPNFLNYMYGTPGGSIQQPNSPTGLTSSGSNAFGGSSS